MIRFLVKTLLQLLANAVGLLIAAAVLSGFSINAEGLIVATLLFTAIEVIGGLFIVNVSEKYVPALTGGVALVSTLVGLILTSMFVDGLQISGIGTWIAATVIVWLVALLASLVMPLFMFKKVLKPDTDKNADKSE